MEPINVNLSCDLQHPVKVRYLDGYFFSKDSAGHKINVDVFNNGVPVSVGGSVSAEVVRSDGETVPVTGAVSENRAYVILPQAAYAVVGAVQITIKVTEGTTIVTIACFVAFVHESDTEITVDPGTIIPSIQALISQIETAVASIPADYSSLWTSLAPAFSTSTAYAVGQYVTNSGVLYRFTTAHPAGTWNSAHVTAVNLGSDISALKSAFDDMRTEYTDISPIDMTDPYTTFITANNEWSVSGSPSPKSAIEKIPDNAKYARFKANPNEVAVIAFLTTDAHRTGTTPDYATGTGRIALTAGTEAEYKIPEDAEYICIFLSRAGTTYQPTTANTISYKEIPYDRISAIEEKIGNVNNTTFTKPASGNAVKNVAFPITANRSILFYWETSESGANSLNLYTRLTTSGSNVDELIENAKPGIVYTVTPENDANYLRIVANATGEITWLYADTITADLLDVHKDISELQKHSTVEPLVNFEFDRTMIDASGIVEKFGLTTDNRDTMFSAVYNAFSELAEDYPAYVTEILDAVDGVDGNTPTGLVYPWYANGITANTTVDIPVVVDEQGQTTQTVSYTFTKAVSAYKVRLYKLSDTNPALPSSGKKKVFIIGGLHGNEVVAPINLYEFAKRLCNPTDNADMLKLRASCDFYIIPYLNGFGGQYLARVNGNLTDVNRNFPTVGWTRTTITESTFSNLATCTFSGKAPGSEFETQLVMALHEQINPDVFVDHHNSGTGQSQFYSVVTNTLVGNTIYQALTDCASTFLENLPQYFGTEYKLFSGGDVSPGTYTGTVGNSDRWSYEQGVIPSGTCEIFEAINFLNGVYNPSPTKYNADSFSVGEYTLRNVLLHLCQYMLKH